MAMNRYDPRKTPDATDWLGTDEGLRIELVQLFHHRMRTRLPNPRLHATFHVIVENQVAMAEPAVIATLARLQDEGLDRHDAVHAIGSVLAEHLYELLKGQGATASGELNAAYAEGLRKLTAAGWQDAG
jgi:hypothetical protein